MKTDIVCTTINDGMFLAAYTREIEAAQAQDRVRLVVIADRKTPQELWWGVKRARDHGINVLCPTLDEQQQFMEKVGRPDMFPWDSDGRRNIGYLMSWRDGADVMISIDDDNLPFKGWLEEHERVLSLDAATFVTSTSGFYNPCVQLDFTPTGTEIWPRGFPYSGKRRPATHTYDQGPCKIAINAGLWAGDPDVDAITRLAIGPLSLHSHRAQAVCLGDGTWAPINSQNTAVRREAIPAYCYFEFTKRFADIWQGYFAQACARAMGQHVRFGGPLTDCTVRNDHDLLDDLRREYDGIMMLDRVLEWLTHLDLGQVNSYSEAWMRLRHELMWLFTKGEGFSPEERTKMFEMCVRMNQWSEVIGRLA